MEFPVLSLEAGILFLVLSVYSNGVTIATRIP